MSAQQWVHDERTPGGLGQVVTLTTTELRRESKGALGGGLSVVIPIAALRGFYAIAYHYVSVGGGNPRPGPSQFLVAWTDANGALRNDTWMVDVGMPSFRALLEALKQLKPDANLLALPPDEAHRRLGVASLSNVQGTTIKIVLAVVLVPMGLCLLLGIVAWLRAM